MGRFSNEPIGYCKKEGKYIKPESNIQLRTLTGAAKLHDIRWSLNHNSEYLKGKKMRLKVNKLGFATLQECTEGNAM